MAKKQVPRAVGNTRRLVRVLPADPSLDGPGVVACSGADRQRRRDQAEAPMPEDKITKFLDLLAGASDESQAVMAFEA
jgi:hypothetical protein